MIPLLIWSYGVATGPWANLSQREARAGGGEAGLMATLFVEIAYIVAGLALVFVTAYPMTLLILFLRLGLLCGGKMLASHDHGCIDVAEPMSIVQFLVGKIGNSMNSGIAVGGAKLYLANNGGQQIYEVAKDFSTFTLFASFPRRLEDLECDNITFLPDGKAAIWSNDAYDNTLNAWEIPFGVCLFGGGPPAQITLTPKVATNVVGNQHCVTATVEDSLANPTPGITVIFSVSGANPQPNASAPTDTSGQASSCYTGTVTGNDSISAFAENGFVR